MKKTTYAIEDLNEIVRTFISDSKDAQIITFTGDLGAGKTTLIRAMMQSMGVPEHMVTSPTFTYLNIYHSADGRLIYHFDLYRLKSLAEFELAGFFDYLYQPNSITLIEWPEVVMPLLRHHICHVDLSVISEYERLLVYSCFL
jgi:tRNA threonylcarbamoyladenosine biosynthesis protein TsaE